jgi:hypothetical protein
MIPKAWPMMGILGDISGGSLGSCFLARQKMRASKGTDAKAARKMI